MADFADSSAATLDVELLVPPIASRLSPVLTVGEQVAMGMPTAAVAPAPRRVSTTGVPLLLFVPAGDLQVQPVGRVRRRPRPRQ